MIDVQAAGLPTGFNTLGRWLSLPAAATISTLGVVCAKLLASCSYEAENG